MAETPENGGGNRPQERITIPHKLSKQFTSHLASGAIMSGPTPDGFYHLIFYSDVIGINHETGVLIREKENSVSYKTKISEGDVERFREDKTRISMTESALEELYRLLKKRFVPGGDEGDDK